MDSAQKILSKIRHIELRTRGIIKGERETEESIAAARAVSLELERLPLEFELLRSTWERHLNLQRI